MQRWPALALLAALGARAAAQPSVPNGFSATRVATLAVSSLSAIDDPGGFGVGVISASASNGIATFRLITPSGAISVLGSYAAPDLQRVQQVTFDAGGLVEPVLHASIRRDPALNVSTYVTLSPGGTPVERWTRGGASNAVGYRLAFTDGSAGNGTGALLHDGNGTNGTELSAMDASYQVSLLSANSIPTGRTDLDIQGISTDVTGLYGGGVLLADTDPNNDNISAIYELRDAQAGGTYRRIGAAVSTQTRVYSGLDIVTQGPFGGVAYVTEFLSGQVQQVAPDGTHTT